jgi:hypothetical protein
MGAALMKYKTAYGGASLRLTSGGKAVATVTLLIR